MHASADGNSNSTPEAHREWTEAESERDTAAPVPPLLVPHLQMSARVSATDVVRARCDAVRQPSTEQTVAV